MHILSQKKKEAECWEMGAEVKKGKGQSDTRVSC